MFQAVLQYDVLTGYQNVTATANRVFAAMSANLAGTIEALGFDKVSDTISFDASLPTVRRTITLRTNAVGDRLWSTADQVKAITTRLFRGGLAQLMPSLVTAAAPVVTTV